MRVCVRCKVEKGDWGFLTSVSTACVPCEAIAIGKAHRQSQKPKRPPGPLHKEAIEAIREQRTKVRGTLRGDAIQVICNNRRCKKRGVHGELTLRDWRVIKASQNDRCIYCKSWPNRLTIDHIVPISKGGPNVPSNIVGACRRCNFKKWTSPPKNWPEPRSASPASSKPLHAHL